MKRAASAGTGGPRRARPRDLDARSPWARELWAGLVCVLVGLAFALGAQAYEMGDAAQMGPGYLPRALGWILSALGLMMALRGLRHPGLPPARAQLRPLLAILAANAVFGLALAGWPTLGLPPLGLVLGVLALVGVASLAQAGARLGPVLALALGLAAFSALVFVRGLGLALPLWPAG